MNETIKDIEETLEAFKLLFDGYKDNKENQSMNFGKFYLASMRVGAMLLEMDCEKLIKEIEDEQK